MTTKSQDADVAFIEALAELLRSKELTELEVKREYGEGDSLNAFDVTLATLVSGIGHIVGQGAEWLPGIHLLPHEVWEKVI